MLSQLGLKLNLELFWGLGVCLFSKVPFNKTSGDFTRRSTHFGGSLMRETDLCPQTFTRCPSIAPLPLFWGEGSPTKIDYREKGALILTSTGGPSLRNGLLVWLILTSDSAGLARRIWIQARAASTFGRFALGSGPSQPVHPEDETMETNDMKLDKPPPASFEDSP